MSAPPTSKGEPITDKAQLVAYLEAGCKPPAEWRIGTEHEKFAYTMEDYRPLPYGGARGIGALLEGMQRFGWSPVFEGENVIALTKDACNITLEPGGQFELSGAPLETIHQTCDEVHTHLAQVKDVAEPLEVAMMGLGFNPKWAHEDTPMMPKSRYEIMSAYMRKVGTMGLDMMFRTCTVQVNPDYESEALWFCLTDCVIEDRAKAKVSLSRPSFIDCDRAKYKAKFGVDFGGGASFTWEGELIGKYSRTFQQISSTGRRYQVWRFIVNG